MSKTYEIACPQEILPLYVDLKKAVEKSRVLTVEVKSRAGKTNEQLGYYWSIVLPRVREGMREYGNEMSLEETNQFLNEKFFCQVKTTSWTDKKGVQHVHVIRKAKSKSGASKDQMSAFLDEVIRFANNELGIFIPEPVTDLLQVPF